MLNQRIDILEAQLPLLLSMPDNTWHLIIDIKKLAPESYLCSCIRQLDNAIQEYAQELSQDPFHVGEGIWELDYGCMLVTLLDDTLNDHPAKKLWQQWRANN
ncbi:MAG: hypothetical protein R8G33_00320 [Gammaproteobacteria bacterium]|nr:hypothetical protein [Gammaproteobacteria bacterium]